MEVEKVPASTRIEVIPAQYEWVEREVTVPPFERRRIIKPEVVEWIEETVVEPARTETRRIPARYRTVMREEPITDTAAPMLVRNRREDGQLCLTAQPTAFRLVPVRELVEPARTETVEIPERTRTVRRKRVIEPAQVEVVKVPAQTQVKRVRVEVVPEQRREVPVPPVMVQERRRVMVDPGRLEWQAVFCDDNAKPERVRALQRALQARGHYRGPVDGRFGPATLAAVQAFQAEAGLPRKGVTLELLAALGVP